MLDRESGLFRIEVFFFLARHRDSVWLRMALFTFFVFLFKFGVVGFASALDFFFREAAQVSRRVGVGFFLPRATPSVPTRCLHRDSARRSASFVFFRIIFDVNLASRQRDVCCILFYSSWFSIRFEHADAVFLPRQLFGFSLFLLMATQRRLQACTRSRVFTLLTYVDLCCRPSNMFVHVWG